MLPAAEALAAHYRCYVPDLPGHGRSVSPSGALTAEYLADWLPRYLDAIGVERAVLMGSSVGSIITLLVAANHPNRVEEIVLIAPAGGKASQPLPKVAAQLALNGLREPRRLVGIAVQDYLRFGLVEGFRYLRGMREFRFGETFDRTPLRALVVVGGRDPLVDPALVNETAHAHGDVTVVEIAGAAHAVNFSHPRELAVATRAFLSGAPIEGEGFASSHHPARGKPAGPQT